MKATKRLRNALAAAAAGAFIVCALGVTPALAEENGIEITPRDAVDHPVNFTLNFWASSDWTNPETKDHDWSTYVYAQEMGIHQCRLEVWGSKDWNGYFTNRTDQGHATLKSRGEFLIDQWVYENGERWAKLKGLYNGYDGYVKGLWSADGIDYGFDRING